MADFETLHLQAGTWSGLLRRERAPARVMLAHMGAAVGPAAITAQSDGVWRIDAQLPPGLLSDGVQSFALLADDGRDDTGSHRGDAEMSVSAERLGTLSIVAGRPLDFDLRAEIDLIRGELDLLKREFRRLATREG